MIDGHQLLKVFLTKQSDEENYKSTLQWMKKSSFEQIEIELPAQLSVQLGMKNYYDVHYSKADSFAFEFNENEVFFANKPSLWPKLFKAKFKYFLPYRKL